MFSSYNTRNTLKMLQSHRVLVFDTETTGLIPKGIHSLEEQPYIIQISYVIYDPISDTEVESYNEYIRLQNMDKLSEVSTNITGITTTILQEKGIDIVDALISFYHAYRQCKEIVAHNLQFDKEMILIEVERNYHAMLKRGCRSPESLFNTLFNKVYDIKYFDTMKEGIDIYENWLKSKENSENKDNRVVVKRMYRKYPKLSELLEALLGELNVKLRKWHDSKEDVEVCKLCYKEMKK
jgi:DNA polymerase III epsilon subunit-like protein